MKDSYDVLVVGAGPAGAIAAKTAAEAGLSVLLIEKRSAIGVPVRCAEGVEINGLRKFIEPDKKWISSELRRALIVGPDGSKFKVSKDKDDGVAGFVLDRKIFDRELVWKAVEAGAEVQVHARASAPVIVNGKVVGAVVHQNGIAHEIRAKIIIAADGVESKFAKWAGINTTVPLGELETCAQYIINDIDIEENTAQFFFSYANAPLGYIWIFPKGKRCANVGVCIAGTKSGEGHRPCDYLDKFVKEKFPNGKITELVVGGVSVCKPLENTAADNMMIVGDAARLSDPMTGGGIYNAMFSGKLAAETAVEAIKAGDTSKAVLSSYDKKWRMSEMGKSLVRNYAIKEVFVGLDDNKLNSLIHSMSDIKLDNINVKNMLVNIVKANPWLIREIPTIMRSL